MSTEAHKRDDIQGLRAFCILAVCIYHAFPSALPGGFIGVDVFFVISGFLITRILVEELNATGRIDLLRFWARRAQRLLPNAMLTLLTVLIATSLLLPAYRRITIVDDLISASAFYSNIRFATRAVDYFQANDVLSPVLHFWSLSLEEQFYFSLPPALCIGLWVSPKGIRRHFATVMLSSICIISFAYGFYKVQVNAPAAFFLFVPRVWQLATGGLIGINLDQFRLPAKWKTSLASLGAIAIALSAGLYSNELSYPGPWALVPTVGAAFVLTFAPQTWVGRSLSVRPLEWIGDRSYSLYLWHWPFLVIAAELWPMNNIAKAVAIAAFVATACAVFPFEDQIRRTKLNYSTSARFGAAIACIGLFCGICAVVLKLPLQTGTASRTEELQRASQDFGQNYRDGCHLGFDAREQPPCIYGDLNSKLVVYLFGDSHAAMWFNPVVKAAEVRGWKVVVRTRSSCPAVSVSIWDPPLKAYYKSCDDWRAAVVREIEINNPQTIIVADYGNYYGWLYDRSAAVVLGSPEARRAWLRGTSALLDSLPKSSKVIIVRDTPVQLKSYKDCVSYADDCGRQREAALAQMEPVDPRLLNERINLMDTSDLICTESWCPVSKSRSIIYQDDHHLTATFAGSLWQAFANQLRREP